MLIAIIGENCVGKSTLAGQISEHIDAKIYSGKDYLRLEKNPSLALSRFRQLLQEAVSGEPVIYIITEKEHVELLPEGTFSIVLTAEFDVIKERFRARMRGNLPLPVEKMLEAKHGMYDNLPCSMKLDAAYDINVVLETIMAASAQIG